MNENGLAQWIWSIALVIIIFCMSACSVDHGGDEVDFDKDGNKTINGTVSAGGPVKGVVILKNATSSTVSISDEIDEEGHFSIELVGDMTGPYVLQARGTVGGRSICLHSIGTRADVSATVNITPFTNLVVGNIIGKDPEEYFVSFNDPVLTKVATEDNINKHEALVRARFKSIFQLFGVYFANINLINTPFNADHTGMDGALDFIRFIPSWDVDGKKMPLMTAKLLLSDDEITDDFTKEDDTTVLTVPDTLLDAKAEMHSIAGVFKAWADLFSDETGNEKSDFEPTVKTKAIPQSDNAELVALFSSYFLQNGLERTEFLAKICVDETSTDNMKNMKISGLALDSLDVDGGKAVVSFTVTNSNDFSEDQYNWELLKTDGSWLIKGNRQRLDCFVGTYAAYSKTKLNIIANGLCIYAWSSLLDETTDIDHIVVSGPGLPDNFVLSRVAEDNRVLFIPTGSSPHGYFQVEDPAVIKDNSEYTFLLYDAENNLITENGYKRYLKKGNIGTDDLLSIKSSIFCDISKPYQDIINDFDEGQASLESSWTTPAYITIKEINYYYNHSGVDTNKRKLLLPEANNYYMNINETNITRIDIYIRCMDIYDRVFDSFLSDSEYVDGTKAKEIINYRENSQYPYRLF